MQLLLAAGADPNRSGLTVGPFGLLRHESALGAAVLGHPRSLHRNFSTQMTTTLLRAGADPCGRGRPCLANLLRPQSPLVNAAAAGNLKVCVKLLAVGADPAELSDAVRMRILVTATKLGDVAVVRALLAARADPNHARIADGRTPLMWACQYGRAEIVKLLLSLGADPHAATVDDGYTALLYVGPGAGGPGVRGRSVTFRNFVLVSGTSSLFAASSLVWHGLLVVRCVHMLFGALAF